MTLSLDPSLDPASAPSPLKRALLAIENLQGRLQSVETAQREPIAIIGMACRFPGGADSPEAFWQLLTEGRDATREVPADRWNVEQYFHPDPNEPGKIYTKRGGFLNQIDQFDPPFFGISAREAASLDPQQRLLLELSWEALEYANLAPDLLQGSNTGVFIGLCANDYNKMIWEAGGAGGVDAFCATGNALSTAAGRLSYTLGLRGPSLVVDTACSSSLVAIHLACQQLRLGECDQALVGGVHLLLSPDTSVAFARTHMLDPDGQCHTFDAEANGYGRGEGGGMVVLKRLSQAEAEGDPILAVIRGSAVNHNGRSSSLIAPNGTAQQSLIQQAIQQAGISPDQVGYVEVQGTGTALGQSLEVGALTSVLAGNPRPPLLLGSVKTNLGHLEAAAGMASLIKVILSLQHQQIPAHLHLHQLNPHIDWQKVSVPTSLTPWPADSLAGISGFGFSGTNAHLVVSAAPVAAPETDPKPQLERPQHLFTLSAKSPAALQALAERYHTYLQAQPAINLADLCFSANTGRAQLSYRFSTMPQSQADLQAKLAELSQGTLPFPPSPTTATPIALYFPGDLGLVTTYAAELYATQPVFRNSIDRCQELAAQPFVLDHPSPMALFALEYGLYQLWQNWGITPSLVFGNGVGELVTGWVAGIFSLEVGLQLAAAWGTAEQANLAASFTYQAPQLSVLSQSGQNMDGAYYWSQPQSTPPDSPVQQLANNRQFAQAYLLPVVGSQDPEPPIIGGQGGENGSTLSIWPMLLTHLGQLYQQGVTINWRGFDQGYPRQHLHLPTYAWQRQRHWFTSKDSHVNPPTTPSVPTQNQPQFIPTSRPLTAQEVQTWLVGQIAAALGVSAEKVPIAAPFDSYGLDSVLAITIATAGKQELGLEVSPLMLLHYPTILVLAEHLAQQSNTETEFFEL